MPVEIEGRSDDIIDKTSTRIRCPGGKCIFFHPGTYFQKSAFTEAVFTGIVWTMSENDAQRAFAPNCVCMWIVL